MNGSLPDPTAAIFYSNSATPLSAAMKPKLGICCCMPVIAAGVLASIHEALRSAGLPLEL